MQDNPCIKNGGWVYLFESNEYVFGDVYQPADGCIQVRVIHDIPDNIQYRKPKGVDLWATIRHQRTTFRDGRMMTITGVGKAHLKWKWTDKGLVQVPTI